MGEKTSVIKIKIISSIIESYKLAWINFRYILSLFWLPILIFLFVVIGNSKYYFDEISMTILEYAFFVIIPISPELSTHKYISLIVEAVVISSAFIALYRFLILDERNQCKLLSYKRGIIKERTIFIIPYFFKFGKRECIFIIAYLSVFLISIIISDIYQYYMAYNASYSDYIAATTLMKYSIVKLMLYYLGFVISAFFILLWPALSISDKFNVGQVIKLISAILGNVIRISIVIMFIFLPLEIISRFMEYLMVYISSMNSEMLPQYVYDFILVINYLIFFSCSIISVCFSSILYKEFKKINKIP